MVYAADHPIAYLVARTFEGLGLAGKVKRRGIMVDIGKNYKYLLSISTSGREGVL